MNDGKRWGVSAVPKWWGQGDYEDDAKAELSFSDFMEALQLSAGWTAIDCDDHGSLPGTIKMAYSSFIT